MSQNVLQQNFQENKQIGIHVRFAPIFFPKISNLVSMNVKKWVQTKGNDSTSVVHRMYLFQAM